MNVKERLTTLLPAGRKRRRWIVAGLLSLILLLCGFVWEWYIWFANPVEFYLDEVIDKDLILNFPDLIDTDDLLAYLEEPLIAEQIIAGVQANLAAEVYSEIEIPDMTEESLGSRILKIIFDRIVD